MKQADLEKKIEHFEALKNKRGKIESIWEDIKKYVCPQGDANTKIYDSTSIWSKEQLASGLQSLMINRATSWFNLNVITDEEEQDQNQGQGINEWVQNIESTILDVFNNAESNFYNQAHQFFLNLAGFGTGIFYIEENLNFPYCVFFKNISINECYFDENRFGIVDTIFRLFSMSVKNAASQWPDSKDLQEKALKDPNETIEILHMVIENPDSKALPYLSVYVYFEDRVILSEGDYSYFPFMVTRWLKEEGEPYGYAPANHVLPDIKLINKLRQLDLQVTEKQLNPPLLVPKTGIGLPLYTSPGSINYYQNGLMDKVVPLAGMENIRPSMEQQNISRDAILKAFYIDIFRMGKENKEMTAAEVQYRNEEQMRMMSPIIGRIETEFLNPLIKAVYKTLAKYKMIAGLGDGNVMPNIDIEYSSPLSKIQKSSIINSVEQVLGFFQRSGISNLNPEVYDNLDFDKMFKMFFELRGGPEGILRGDAEVRKVRQQRQMQQQMQQTQQM